MSKTCKKCGKVGNPDEFMKDRNVCKDCRSLQNKQYQIDNRERILSQRAQFRATKNIFNVKKDNKSEYDIKESIIKQIKYYKNKISILEDSLESLNKLQV